MKIKSKIEYIESIKMMRKIRDTLSKKYSQNPNMEKKDLQIIRNKYGIQ